MNLSINGQSHELDSPASVADLLQHLGMAERRVAVERNGELVPRSLHAQQQLSDGDRIEIVQAIGGG